jgi:hypothetical protein
MYNPSALWPDEPDYLKEAFELVVYEWLRSNAVAFSRCPRRQHSAMRNTGGAYVGWSRWRAVDGALEDDALKTGECAKALTVPWIEDRHLLWLTATSAGPAAAACSHCHRFSSPCIMSPRSSLTLDSWPVASSDASRTAQWRSQQGGRVGLGPPYDLAQPIYLM